MPPVRRGITTHLDGRRDGIKTREPLPEREMEKEQIIGLLLAILMVTSMIAYAALI